jgi:hypothetical protein
MSSETHVVSYGQTDMTKLTAIFRNIVKAPNKLYTNSQFLVRMHSDRQKEHTSIDERWRYQRQEDETNLDGFMILLVIIINFSFSNQNFSFLI